jgi:hypothetical protein
MSGLGSGLEAAVLPWVVDGYVEGPVLGEGAQGRVVLARHRTSAEIVAIKYLQGDDEAAFARFRQEARLLTQVDNPNVARLLGYVEKPGVGAAIVMEAVNGVSLKAVLAEHGTLEPEIALAVLKGSLAGLAAAHSVGVVHRDYKPANVVVRGDGCSKLVDFGVAGLMGTGSRSGTPAYMAPEQWFNEPSTPATDVYAATCVFVECMTGHPPFDGRDQATLAAQHTTGQVPVDDLPEPLRPLVLRGMAKQPGDRPVGALALVAELEAVAVEVYGQDWERRAVEGLASATAVLAAAFPLALPLLSAGALQGSAVTSSSVVAAEAGKAGSLAGKTFLAKIGGAYTVAILTGVAVVATIAVPVTIVAGKHQSKPRATAQQVAVPLSRLCPSAKDRCLGTRTADVDGNGQVDSLGLAVEAQKLVLRAVLNGRGETVVTNVADVGDPSGWGAGSSLLGWAGIGDIDGDKGDELFFVTEFGSSSIIHTVRTWHDGGFTLPEGDFPDGFMTGKAASYATFFGCRPRQFTLLVAGTELSKPTAGWSLTESDYTVDASGIWKKSRVQTGSTTKSQVFDGDLVAEAGLTSCFRPGTEPRTQEGFLDSVDLTGLTANVDPAAFLTGEAMRKACAEEGVTVHQDMELCNDYFISNPDETKSKFKVLPTATGTIVDGPSFLPKVCPADDTISCSVTLAQLAQALATKGHAILMRMTIQDGYISSFEEIFHP